MNITPFEIVQLVFDLVVIVFAVLAYRKLWELDLFKKGLIAHARAVPDPPTTQLIAQWETTYNGLPDFLPSGDPHPKKNAYRKRLIEVGVMELDEFGNTVKVKELDGD